MKKKESEYTGKSFECYYSFTKFRTAERFSLAERFRIHLRFMSVASASFTNYNTLKNGVNYKNKFNLMCLIILLNKDITERITKKTIYR